MTKPVDLRSLVGEAVELTDSDKADIAALQMALDLILDNDPPDQGKIEQVTDFLNKRDPWEVAKFCSLCQQKRRLELLLWMDAPCQIHTRERAEAILAKGHRPAYGGGDDISDCGPARLTLDMIDLGISRWHPDPMRAIAEAKRAMRKH
jgi:hypothetical protein